MEVPEFRDAMQFGNLPVFSLHLIKTLVDEGKCKARQWAESRTACWAIRKQLCSSPRKVFLFLWTHRQWPIALPCGQANEPWNCTLKNIFGWGVQLHTCCRDSKTELKWVHVAAQQKTSTTGSERDWDAKNDTAIWISAVATRVFQTRRSGSAQTMKHCVE